MANCVKRSDGGNNCVRRLSDVVWDEITVETICKSPDAKFANVQQMVDYYQNNLKEPTEKWLRSLTENQDSSLWITNFICGEANISREPANRKFCKNLHQRRRTADVIIAARNILEKADFDKCNSFREILEKTIDLTKDLKWFGPLCYYDFSLRYAFHRNIFPKEVYVHAGTMIGLKCLMNIKKDIETKEDDKFGLIIENLSSLPKEIADIGALHIENFLCIFHDHLLRYENYLRGVAGDKKPNYGIYRQKKQQKKNEKEKSRESKCIKMRRELDEIFRTAKEYASFDN